MCVVSLPLDGVQKVCKDVRELSPACFWFDFCRLFYSLVFYFRVRVCVAADTYVKYMRVSCLMYRLSSLMYVNGIY